MDGPVVRAAVKALETGDVEALLPYVHEEGEAEVRHVFTEVTQARRLGPAAQAVADRYLFETVVRVHRAGERAPYTGLKPAGLDHGPVIPVAELALTTGSVDELLIFLADTVHTEVRKRFNAAMALKPAAERSVAAAREYVEAMLGLQVYANALYQFAKTGPDHGAHQRME
jgi:hypothetical protein